jgi:hypothetical protein
MGRGDEGSEAMSNVFYGAWLWRSGGLGWATHTARFPNTLILATIQLSSFSTQNGDRFDAFQHHYAQAYIETVNTPIIVIGGVAIPNPNKLTDNNVWLTTDHVTFQLQADNANGSASAFGLIHDRSSVLAGVDVERTLDFAVYDDDGLVVATHREVQLDGGSAVDSDEVQERILGRTAARSDRSLSIVPVDPDYLSGGTPFRIDPRTKNAVADE